MYLGLITSVYYLFFKNTSNSYFHISNDWLSMAGMGKYYRGRKRVQSQYLKEKPLFSFGLWHWEFINGKYKHLRNRVLGFFCHNCSQGKSSLQILDIAPDYQITRNSLGALLSARKVLHLSSQFSSNQGEIKY